MTRDEPVPSDAQMWRARVEEGLSRHEEAQFKRWLEEDIAHRDAFLEAEIAWGRLATINYDRPDQPSAISAANDLYDLELDRYSERPSAYLAVGTRVLAASLAVILVFGGLLLTGSFPKWTEGDELQRYQLASSDTQSKIATLPDGSRISLEPGAEVQVTYSETSRILILRAGGASFRVAKNTQRPFLVRTGAATITVTGTWFDAELKDDGVEVRVREGSVDVGPANDEPGPESSKVPISLIEGEAIWTGDGINITRLDSSFEAQPTAVQAQQRSQPRLKTVSEPEQFTYRQAPLSQVVADVNRYAQKPIKLDPSASHLTLSGRFKSDEVEGIIATIEEALPVKLIDNDGERLIVID